MRSSKILPRNNSQFYNCLGRSPPDPREEKGTRSCDVKRYITAGVTRDKQSQKESDRVEKSRRVSQSNSDGSFVHQDDVLLIGLVIHIRPQIEAFLNLNKLQ